MSAVSEDLEAQLDAWCQSYVTAFSAYDAGGIEAHWAFPALIVHQGRQSSFKTAEQFTANTSALLSFYKRQGVAKAERKLLSCMKMAHNAASMCVEDVMLDAGGGEIVGWQAAYVLHRISGEWRAIFAVADGEGEAWKARGTPLGS